MEDFWDRYKIAIILGIIFIINFWIAFNVISIKVNDIEEQHNRIEKDIKTLLEMSKGK